MNDNRYLSITAFSKRYFSGLMIINSTTQLNNLFSYASKHFSISLSTGNAPRRLAVFLLYSILHKVHLSLTSVLLSSGDRPTTLQRKCLHSFVHSNSNMYIQNRLSILGIVLLKHTTVPSKQASFTASQFQVSSSGATISPTTHLCAILKRRQNFMLY